MRGPYGNGFEKENYQGKELIVVAGGTGVSPVRGVISYFGEHQNEVKKLHTILGFKSPSDILFREDLKKWEQQMDLILTVDCIPMTMLIGQDLLQSIFRSLNLIISMRLQLLLSDLRS